MTVKEAFEKYGTIEIYYTMFFICDECHEKIEYSKDEYSFKGNLDNFKDYYKDHALIELSDEVIETEKGKFEFFREDYERVICEQCQDKLLSRGV